MHLIQRAPRIRRRAFTLVELMIAITIASVLTVIALPKVKDAMRQNIATRSATIVKGALVNARAQAIRTGRPFGVVIERQRHDIGEGTPDVLNFTAANYASRIYYVQTPLAYRGDSDDAYAYWFIDDDDNEPKFFIPETHAGLVSAAAMRPQGPASQIVSTGTQMAIGESTHAFTITNLTYVTTLGTRAPSPPSSMSGPGTIVEYNYASMSPTFRIGTNLNEHQGYRFEILSLPMRAPFTPVNVTGKTVIDLSISGTGADPVAFNTQAIVGSGSIPTGSGYEFGDVIIMFAPDGRVDSIFLDQPDGSGYTFTRVVPSTTLALAVGYVDGIVDNVDDNARYPENVPGTSYPTGADDPPLAMPEPPDDLEVDQVPNFANTEGAWVTIQPMSGAVGLETIAAQPTLSALTSYYGFGTNPGQSAREVVEARIRQSRRLTSAGATQ